MYKRTHIVYLSMMLIAIFTCFSCKDSLPQGVLGEKDMENLLYDYHVSQALAQQMPPDSVDFYTRLYAEAVFQKYGTNQQGFDLSMQWYERHTSQLKTIYDHLADRLGGGSNGETTPLPAGMNGTSNDTINVWKGPSYILFNSQSVNHFSYSLPADTTIHANDMLQWTFNADWFYHDGERRAIACATIHYANDSIAVFRQSVLSSGQQTFSIRLGNLPVKSIDCFIYQCSPWAERSRILFISNIRLYRVRMHDLPLSPPGQSLDNDTVIKMPINRHRIIRDSLMKQEQDNEKKPHFV